VSGSAVTRRRLLLLAMLGISWPLSRPFAASGMVTEVITIGYRPVEEMIAILKPMVPKPGSVSGAYGKIVIRTTPENMREIKAILATLNRAPANLLVSVRHSINDEVRRDLYEAFGEVASGNVGISTGRATTGERGLAIGLEDDGQTAGVRIDEAKTTGDEGITQRVRVLEGKEAFVQAGQSVPITSQRRVISGTGVTTVQSTTAYRNVDSGFYVRARLNDDDQVTVEIFPQRNRIDTRSGSIDVREASTVVTSRLGRWMQIGGVGGTSSDSRREIGASSSSNTRSDFVTFLKVERLD
jgi:type II secretory pathway component GspD/PulD (secretin)